ncbi:alkaline phosphatase family protein [Micromonospora yangpuensis]|uniref:phospholipase C n=1 Tax=Micromonospora yangpuensis TaxID=683228 RepID=A0A1C6U824_9ACTN|nr:alkaline phosphatase family protein [Micromonospora yangpuensis]GGL89782.1 putative non-hemolytic phospholipase C [Micromonospora yangpuensis]SCL50124.1 phospholipase C [Micromonospora yangpuensis]
MTDPGARTGRRRLTSAAALLLALLLANLAPAGAALAAPAAGRATTTPIDHFIFLMQENHTFDNYFGTREGVDGIPKDVCMPVKAGQPEPCVTPFHIGDLGAIDLDHSAEAFRQQYNGGRMDGFVEGVSSQGKDGKMAMAYYDDRDLPFYWNVADEYVLFDRFFSSSNSGSIRNHMYRVTGGPGAAGKAETIPAQGWGDIPTIFDRLEAAGISWKFYVQNYDPTITFRSRVEEENIDRGAQVIWVPLLAYARYVDDPRLSSKIVDLDEYYTDAATGNLPAVSFVAPSGNSEHPPGNIASGQNLVRSLITQLMRSPAWPSSAFLWSYDDWGGWYDHVKPPQVDRYGYGFRVPTLLVSPYARRGYVDSTTLDFTSALKFIQVNWGVEPLAERDAKAETFLGAFDFRSPPRPAVLLGTEREPAAVHRPDPVPVYASYATALGLVGTLLGVALVRGRRVR